MSNILGEEWRKSSRKNEEAGLKQKCHSVVDVSGGEGKVQCSKEQYCSGTWNLRSMNQGKLDVVKQEMERVNIDILGTSELKWIEPWSPALQADSLSAEPQRKPKNTGMDGLSLLQWIFPSQESNWGLLHCRWILYQLSYQGSPELKWMGMGEFNSDDHYIYYCGQESLRRNGVALIVNKRVWNAVLGAISKLTDLGLFPRQTIQYHSNPSLRSNH